MKPIRPRIPDTLCALFVGIALAACGNGNGGEDPPAEGGGAGGGVNGPQAGREWSSVIRSAECTPPENRPLCVQGGFSVSRDGSFVFSDSNGTSEGSISERDMQELSAEALDVVRGDLDGELECDDDIALIPEIQSIEASVVRPDGEPIVFFRLNRTEGLCWRGARVEADELESEIEDLLQEYVVEGEAGIPEN